MTLTEHMKPGCKQGSEWSQLSREFCAKYLAIWLRYAMSNKYSSSNKFQNFYTNLNMRRNHFYPSIKIQQLPRCEEYPRITLIRNNYQTQEVRRKLQAMKITNKYF